MATFALAHGALHGAWCWELLTPLLRQAGHDVVAMDLPVDDNSARFDTYADVVCAALDGCDDDVVLVGTLARGNAIPLVVARCPVQHLVVYPCAGVPDIGKSLADQLGDEPDMLNPACYARLKADTQSRMAWADVALARALMYADCDEPTSQAAIRRLRPQSAYGYSLPTSLAVTPLWVRRNALRWVS